jgi:hypothetical protein
MGLMKDSSRSDWLPGRRDLVIEMADVWLAYITPERAAAWGVPAAELAELSAKRNTAQTKLTVSTGPEGSQRLRTECNTAFAELKSLMRHIKNHRFQKPELSDGDFTALGLAVPDGSRTPIPPPVEDAPFSMRPKAYMQVLLHHGKKPYGANGAIFRYAVLPPGSPAPTYEQLTESMLLTRINEYLDFPDTQEGHTLYGSLQWQSEKGDKGPPTPVQSLVLG